MVETMERVQVDAIHAGPTQAVVDLGEDCLPRKSGPNGAGTHPAIHLGGYNHLIASGEVPDCAAQNFFAVAERIAIGGVKEIDARLEGLLDEWPALLLGQAPGMIAEIAAAIAHAAEANARDIEACAAELAIFHRLSRPICYCGVR